MTELGVNIDHVATIRQARRAREPDPVWAAALAVLGGADGITVHLREDRRHIQDRDVRVLRETLSVKLNLEMACSEDVLAVALEVMPQQATLVPENRQEITTEGGLDVLSNRSQVAKTIDRLREGGIVVSLFLDPDAKQIDAARELEADAVELHTGAYANAAGELRRRRLIELIHAAKHIRDLGLVLHAGHGLNYHNVVPIARIDGMAELNIGHAIVARSVLVGMERAVREMRDLIRGTA